MHFLFFLNTHLPAGYNTRFFKHITCIIFNCIIFYMTTLIVFNIFFVKNDQLQ